MCKKLIKNSQPFGKKCQKTAGGIFLTHTVYTLHDFDALSAFILLYAALCVSVSVGWNVSMRASGVDAANAYDIKLWEISK